jgi:thiol-disulfide isomerase/thioredoxin
VTAPRPTGRFSRPLIGPFSARHVLALLGTIAAIALVLVVATSPIAGPASTPIPTPGSTFFVIGSPTVGLEPGDLAPELTGTIDGQVVQLMDLDGRPITLAELRGRPVWINFWASWCPPCQAETPVLRKVFETHREQGLAVVGISVQETTVEDVRRYVETYELGYTVGFDATSAIFKTYRAFGLPTQVFVDREGVIRNVVLGPVTEIAAERILAPLLDED